MTSRTFLSLTYIASLPLALGAISLFSFLLGGAGWHLLLGALLVAYGVAVRRRHRSVIAAGRVLVVIVGLRQAIAVMLAVVGGEYFLIAVAIAPWALLYWFTVQVHRQLLRSAREDDSGSDVTPGGRAFGLQERPPTRGLCIVTHCPAFARGGAGASVEDDGNGVQSPVHWSRMDDSEAFIGNPITACSSISKPPRSALDRSFISMELGLTANFSKMGYELVVLRGTMAPGAYEVRVPARSVATGDRTVSTGTSRYSTIASPERDLASAEEYGKALI